jgi:succinyl-CoA synthetase beta subunit
MKLYEYQARQLLADAKIPVPGAATASNANEAKAAYERLAADGAELAVVKAQVHAGGRGKGGGVKLVRSAQEAFDVTGPMMDKPLVTHQTGPEGVPVNTVMVAAGVDIEKEYYVSITLDRALGCPVMIASAEGGVEIEKVAEENPEAILKQPIHPLMGLAGHQARSMAFKLGFSGKQVGQAAGVFMKLAKLFVESDADMVEVNPLIVTHPTDDAPDGRVIAIDAKITIDDNALFRHKDLAALDDGSETPESERMAQEHDLNFIQLDGSIGCLVNGAGLAMATMDIIKLHGAEPANFLDVGGSATEEAVTEAFRIILKDDKVTGVLVNIFGGIMQCDKIARAIVGAASNIGFDVPLVVRLEGTNVEAAREVIEAAKADIPTMQMATDLTDAAKKITAAVNA